MLHSDSDEDVSYFVYFDYILSFVRVGLGYFFTFAHAKMRTFVKWGESTYSLRWRIIISGVNGFEQNKQPLDSLQRTD